jgi:hypothetical protein
MVVSANVCVILRVTGNAVQLDGFVRNFELLDDLEIVAISRPKNVPGQIGEDYSRAVDDISLDLHFAIAQSAESTYELVMDQYHQQAGIEIRIEMVDDRGGVAEEPFLVRPSA